MSRELVAQIRQALQRQLVQAILHNERVARMHGLRVTDLQTLHLLVLRDDVRTPRQISDCTGMPTSTVTKLVDRLEAAGFITRSTDPADRRKTILVLEPDAIEPLHTFYSHADDKFDAIAEEFDARELETIARYLTEVSNFYSTEAEMQ